ncbi:MAG: SDR family NAD(P)-dependent oxidoreductase [Pseudobdellovibrionaceae bacterium]
MTESKIALITGGTRGLGKELVSAFLGAGYLVIGVYGHDEHAANELRKTFAKEKLLVKKCNLANPEEIEILFKEISEIYGRLDVVINNAAAFFEPTTFNRLSWQDFQKQIDVSLKGSFHILKFAAEIMRKKKDGAVLSILTNAIKSTPPKGFTAYAAAKSALWSLMKSFHAEFARLNIRTYNILPGFMDTSLTQAWHELMVEQIKSASTSKNFVDKKKIAHICLELASSAQQEKTDYFIEE